MICRLSICCPRTACCSICWSRYSSSWGCRGLRRRTSDRGLLRFAVGAFLVVSALGAVFAALVYIMAAPLAQPDMVDFYRMYRPGALIFLLGLFIIQFVFGVAAVYRGK